MAGAGIAARNWQDNNNQQFGINPGALLQTPGRLPAAGSLLRQSAGTNQTQLEGELRVKFDNAPPGMRVESTQSNQPGLLVRSNVGQRSLGGG